MAGRKIRAKKNIRARRFQFAITGAVPGLREVVRRVNSLLLQVRQDQNAPAMHGTALAIRDIRRREASELALIVMKCKPDGLQVAHHLGNFRSRSRLLDRAREAKPQTTDNDDGCRGFDRDASEPTRS